MATEISARLGKRVRELRRGRKWRQIDLAAHAKLSETYICELEKGKWGIDVQTLERIADALNVKISDLFLSIGK